MTEEITCEAAPEAEVMDEKPQKEITEEKSQLPSTIGSVGLVEKGYVAPTNAQEAYELARLLSSVAGSSFKGDISKIATAILAGQEAGLPPVYSVRNIAIINGNATMWGDALFALVQASGEMEDFSVQEIGTKFDIDNTDVANWSDDFGFAVSVKRKGQETPYKSSFTVGDAKRAKLWLNTNKSPWINYPKRMLEIRAYTPALRKGFADVLAGLHFREEVEDYHETPKENANALLSDEPDEIETVEAVEVEEDQ